MVCDFPILLNVSNQIISELFYKFSPKYMDLQVLRWDKPKN